MIYNIRYRGPFEYDKYVLNILSYSNQVKLLLKESRSGEIADIISMTKKIDEMTDNMCGEKGMLNEFNKLKLKLMEGVTAGGN